MRRFLLSEAVLTDGRIDAAKLPLLGRLGGPYYTDVSVLDRTAHLMEDD